VAGPIRPATLCLDEAQPTRRICIPGAAAMKVMWMETHA